MDNDSFLSRGGGGGGRTMWGGSSGLSNLFLLRSAPTGGASGAQHARCASFSSVSGSQPDEEVPQSPLSEATGSTVALRGGIMLRL
jgi:hypothetical protein